MLLNNSYTHITKCICILSEYILFITISSSRLAYYIYYNIIIVSLWRSSLLRSISHITPRCTSSKSTKYLKYNYIYIRIYARVHIQQHLMLLNHIVWFFSYNSHTFDRLTVLRNSHPFVYINH